MKKLLLLFAILNFFQHRIIAQNVKASDEQRQTIEALLTLLNKDKQACPELCHVDTTTINHLNALCRKYQSIGQYDTALYYGNAALDIGKKINFRKGITTSYGNMGSVYLQQGSYPKALEYYFKALKFNEEMGEKSEIAKTIANIGIVYYSQGDYSKTLEYYFKALKISEELGNKNSISAILGNIGIVYAEQAGAAIPDSVAYRERLYTKALECYFKVLKIGEELGNKNSIANLLVNIGNVYHDQKDYPKALEYYFKALKIKEKIGDKNGIAINLGNIGTLYIKQKKYKEAEEYLLKSAKLSQEIGDLYGVMEVNQNLSALYFAKGEYKNAYEHQAIHHRVKDSIFNIEKHDDITRKEMNYEYEKKETIAKAEQEKKEVLHQAEVEHQKTQRNGFIAGFALMLTLAGMSYRSYRNKRKAHEIIMLQKVEVEHQKSLVDEKNRDITDSINYAKRLQQAILPSEKSVKENLKDSFIVYNPKDIVAGDFYWMEKKEDLVFFAAADCTGHGVPGAIVSVVCSNALNRTVKEFGLTEPSKILDKVRELVIETFEKSESEVKDGMDISLCAINKRTNEITWAGANNPLWYVSNDKLKEIKPDKQPIGKHEAAKPFTSHTLQLSKGDLIYLFTDGFADQFGGEKGKKFMTKNMKGLFLSIAQKPLSEQKEILNTTFLEWKGNLEQVDDVCIVGVRI